MISTEFTYPDEKRIEFLKTRPWYSDNYEPLNQTLQRIAPNTHIVAPNYIDIPPEKINKDGCLCNGNIIYHEMEPCACHDNVLILYRNKQIEQIYTGYALFNDGLWRYHSWGIDKRGNIIETTNNGVRLIYFGIENTEFGIENLTRCWC